MTTTVGAVASVKGGKRLPAGFALQDDPTPHPYIRVTDMRDGGVDESGIRYVPVAAAPAIRAYRIFKNDIFISVAGTLGIVGRIPPRLDGANLTENADRLTDIKCDVDYLSHYLRSAPIQNEIDSIRTVGAQPKLALGRIKKFELLLPGDRAEQRLIATALNDVDQLIRRLDRLIAKKRAIKQGLAQELLTGRTRLPGFSGEWTTHRLSDLGNFLRGRGIKRDEVRPSGVPCIRYGELYTTYADYTASTVSYVDPSVAATALPIRPGDILFAGSGETKEEIGMSVAYIGDAPAVAGGDIIVLRGDGYDPVFLAVLLNSPEVASRKAQGGQGDAVVHINWRVLANIEVTLPPPDEQRAIAGYLLDADAEIEALGRRLETARAIKQGMTQELLTGRTRLVAEGAA
ncbi:restriction endonuclease subunit S [Actinomadura chibensis]|uniref:restriction endonuclease subunit S n=1 Tax=Actinomadura chibensis TaxID=392828 RepID=UPI001470AD1B|nr:restriction endonuclease subunit S [Actinomadura chibensis]